MTQVDTQQIEPPIDDKARQQKIADLTAKRDAMLADLQRQTDADLAALTADASLEVPAAAAQLASVKQVIPDYLTQQREIIRQAARVDAFRTFMLNQTKDLTSANEKGEAVAVPTMEDQFAAFVANEPA